MNTDFQQKFKWSNEHMEKVQEILENFFIKKNEILVKMEQATFKQDTEQCTDLVLYFASNKIMQIALRIRKTELRDFTLRTSMATGKATEIDKIRKNDCPCRLYLYCWTDAQDEIEDYIIVDLKKCRDNGFFYAQTMQIKNKEQGVDSIFNCYSINFLETAYDESLILEKHITLKPKRQID